MNKARHGRGEPGFTLIELLTVLAIIAVLATLIYAASEHALESARRTVALNDVHEIVEAVNAYDTEYGRYPLTPDQEGSEVTYRTDNRDLIYTLMAVPSGANAGNALNPRGIAFLQVPAAKNQSAPRSGLANGVWYDPWGRQVGKPESGVYHVRIDGAYRGYVADPYPGYDGDSGGAAPDAPVIHTGVIAWSLAGGGLQTYDLEDQVISWQ